MSALFSGISTRLGEVLSPKIALFQGNDEPLSKAEGPSGVEKCEFRIEGMTCGACVEVSQDYRFLSGEI